MKTKFNGILALLLAFFVQISFAQEKTITGTVSDESGPLPGVSVVIQGTSTGTVTDFDGKYTIKARTGVVLQFSFVGMETQTKTVGAANVMNVTMSGTNVLQEVVVTALGIKREKQALGYAVSEVKADVLEQRAEGDFGRVLSGKASGVVINQTSGISGSGTNIVIRGYTSITGSNQPLFIVDGVPFNGETNAVGNFVNGNSGSSRFLDIDPNNIESVSVLKGFSAATLYGTEGKNGVILITTKSGSSKKGAKKTEITFNQSVFFNQIASLPDYQNTFGNGFDQAFGNFYSNWGPAFYPDGLGGYSLPGSGINAGGTILHPSSRPALVDVYPQYQGLQIPWKAEPNNVKDFFRTGTVLSTSLNFNGSSDDGKNTYNFNFGHLDDEGFTPGNKLGRATISAGGKAELTNKFTISGTMNYSKTDFITPPVAYSSGSGVSGTGLSIFADIFYTPRNVDLQNWPYQHPINGSNIHYRQGNDIPNPYWVINNSYVKQLTNRTFGNAALSYKFYDNLILSYRAGYDFYNERNEIATNKGTGVVPLGGYSTYDNNNLIFDHNISFTGSYSITDKLGFNFNLGATSRYEKYDRQGVSSADQGIFDVFRHYNFASQAPIQYTEKRNTVGLYAQTEFDYDKAVYLTLSGRRDQVSNTFENDMIYPSASLSFIPSKFIDGITSPNGINFLKLRTGWGTSAGFAEGYPVANTIAGVARNFSDLSGAIFASQSTSSLLGNPNLKPELYSEIEFGVEAKLFSNRVNLDFSYFKRETKDLITRAPIANSTGYTETFTNIGLMKGDGFEVDLGLHLIKNEGSGFNWNVNTNFTTSKMIVKDLGGNNNLTIAGYTNLGNQAIVGEQIGVMVGSRIRRDANGDFVVNSSGNYDIEEGNYIIGNPNP
ncbi:MAG: SusC/RagA family TonB-linked outer membrane protein, partial [Flavobacteriaceae bacterium]|nr:SusC/RagA family TonB-linked outer membrane protein [Flavobacteriaceae bacterium]